MHSTCFHKFGEDWSPVKKKKHTRTQSSHPARRSKLDFVSNLPSSFQAATAANSSPQHPCDNLPLHPSSLRGNLGASLPGLVGLSVPCACRQAELNWPAEKQHCLLKLNCAKGGNLRNIIITWEKKKVSRLIITSGNWRISLMLSGSATVEHYNGLLHY